MRSARSGTASLELALVAPILLVMFLGLVDISGALLTARRMQTAADAIAFTASTYSSQTMSRSQGLNQLTALEALDATTAAYALFPQWARSTQPNFAVTLSGISSAENPDGSYTPDVVWSVYTSHGLKQWRACGPIATFGNNNNPDYAHVSIDDVGPTSFFIADVRWTFTPVFFSGLVGSIPMMTSASVSARIGNGTALLSTSAYPTAISCAARQ